MDSYLIRIYRRSPNDPENLVGIVENIDTGQQHSFNSLAGMCQAVSATGPHGKNQPTGNPPTYAKQENTTGG